MTPAAEQSSVVPAPYTSPTRTEIRAVVTGTGNGLVRDQIVRPSSVPTFVSSATQPFAQPGTGVVVPSRTNCANARRKFVSGTASGSIPAIESSVRISTRACALIAGTTSSPGTAWPKKSGRFDSVPFTSKTPVSQTEPAGVSSAAGGVPEANVVLL